MAESAGMDQDGSAGIPRLDRRPVGGGISTRQQSDLTALKALTPCPSPKGRGERRESARSAGRGWWPRTRLSESLKKRTLTNLYNQRPAWLDMAHKKLDAAVFAAYGWDPGLSDEQLLERLLALNLERAGR